MRKSGQILATILNPTMRTVAFLYGGIKMQFDLLQKLRTNKPMVLNIANSVTQSDVANGLSAIGASTLMTNYDDELKTLAQFADGVCINIGTLDDHQNMLSKDLLNLATDFNKPVVLDPVGIGAVPERLNFVEELIKIDHPTVIRGNAGEIASLVGVSWQSKGIDSLDTTEQSEDIDKIAQSCANKFTCVTVVTGPTDTIATSTELAHVQNGNPMFTVRVGTGDMLSSIIAAFAGVSDDPFEAAKMASLTFSLAGEMVMSDHPEVGPAEFSTRLIDNLYSLSSDQLEEWGKFDE